MWTIFTKEIRSFFSSLIGYMVIGIFGLILGLIMWVFPDFSILNYGYASLDQLFSLSPMIFLFLIPAVTMRSFSEELQNGTLEILLTKPIREMDIVAGKFLASLALAGIALIPSLLYFYSVYQLGSPRGNIDTGAVMGSYIGLVLLASGFTAIGIFCSSLFKNQIVAFLASAAVSYLFYFGFFFISKLPVFFGKTDDLIQQFGMDYHFNAISKGLIQFPDVVYFLTLALFFLYLTVESLKRRAF
ncbi:MAG TPA: gliding motility-associated ABC transporter permease subunit GldF [Saprospiraceae bacterium]|nr:gliding motility-associated ABC transporter permease subunit GldF [Saprospiraceae bacterium]